MAMKSSATEETNGEVVQKYSCVRTTRAISGDFKALEKEQVPMCFATGLEPRGQHSSAGSMEHPGKQVENWFQFFPCCPRLRCASQCTALSGRWGTTSLWLKRDRNTVELNRQSSGQWYGNLESTGPLLSQYEQWCLDSVTYGREGRRKMGQRIAQKLNMRKVQETLKTLICVLAYSFGVNWPVHTWLWPWGLSSDFHSSPLHCFFHCGTFWHFISSLDLQTLQIWYW